MEDPDGTVVLLRGGAPARDPRAPYEGVVELVERLLGLAKSGELRGISAALMYSDDSIGRLTSWAPGVRVADIIASSAILQQQVVNLAVDMNGEDGTEE